MAQGCLGVRSHLALRSSCVRHPFLTCHAKLYPLQKKVSPTPAATRFDLKTWHKGTRMCQVRIRAAQALLQIGCRKQCVPTSSAMTSGTIGRWYNYNYNNNNNSNSNSNSNNNNSNNGTWSCQQISRYSTSSSKLAATSYLHLRDNQKLWPENLG